MKGSVEENFPEKERYDIIHVNFDSIGKVLIIWIRIRVVNPVPDPQL